MGIGETKTFSYAGASDEHYIFTGHMLSEVLNIPKTKLFGESLLTVGGKFLIKRQTFSQYCVLPAN